MMGVSLNDLKQNQQMESHNKETTYGGDLKKLE